MNEKWNAVNHPSIKIAGSRAKEIGLNRNVFNSEDWQKIQVALSSICMSKTFTFEQSENQCDMVISPNFKFDLWSYDGNTYPGVILPVMIKNENWYSNFSILFALHKKDIEYSVSCFVAKEDEDSIEIDMVNSVFYKNLKDTHQATSELFQDLILHLHDQGLIDHKDTL